MSDDALALAKEKYAQGYFTDALRLAKLAPVRGTQDSNERDCLICECLQFTGEFEQALKLAETAQTKPLTAEHTARYWEAVGRIRLDQVRREEASEAFRKAIRAATRSGDTGNLATAQQLWLIAAGETLGPGLPSAVREAYYAAVRAADGTVLAGFHLRVSRLEGQRGSFSQSLHHLSLAKSLLDRCPHAALLALYYVNRSCVLAIAGSFDKARESGEMGARLAEQCGHARLAMAAATTVAYAAMAAGDLTVADSWLRKARKAAQNLGITEVGVLDNLATLALIQGDLKAATEHLEEARKFFVSREPKWASATEILTLFTELSLHRRSNNKADFDLVLDLIRITSETLRDQHSQLLGNLAQAELFFDEGTYDRAEQETARCLLRALHHPVYLAQMNRLIARSLWIRGHRASSRRMLLRSASSAFLHGTPIAWTDALRELESTGETGPHDLAYSFPDQLKQARAKFPALMKDQPRTWYEDERRAQSVAQDPLDGFDDAVAILLTSADPELIGREALAAAIGLGISEGAALVARSDSGPKVIASNLSKTEAERLIRSPAALERMEIGKLDHKAYELVLQPKQDLRSLFAVSGIRRLLEAAKAIEAQQKDQQRIGSLWQPEIIIEEPDAVFSSPQMIELMHTAKKVAATTLPVLLLGATGTGKEVIARAIHRASPRAKKVFLPFNCSAVPRDMVESQLFGYRRGSFTGAHVDFPGVIRSAEGGTLFLDEIGELSMDLQPKLLRFLETNEVHPLGEGRPIKVDVRIIAATNADLDDLIQLKQFREDLYYRLNIVRFHMPQLNERREEIPPLVTHLLRRFEMDEKKHGIKFSDEMMEYLLLYKWPGNIRQLSNELRKMVAMVGSNETITPDHLSPAIRATRRTIAVDPDAAPAESPAEAAPAETAEVKNVTVNLDQPLPGAVEALERAMIDHAMARAGGRLEEAARMLGISRKGLFLKRRRWTPGGQPPSNTP